MKYVLTLCIKEIKSILVTEPKADDSKKVKKTKFANKKNFEVIEYEQEDAQYENEDEEFIIPAATNFEVRFLYNKVQSWKFCGENSKALKCLLPPLSVL